MIEYELCYNPHIEGIEMRKKLTTVGNSVALVMTRDMLGLLGIKTSDEIEISFSGRTMLLRGLPEAERAESVSRAIDQVFERHDGALRRLATLGDEADTKG